MKPHQKLEAWKLSFDFVKKMYSHTASFPTDEKFGSQIRRASVSIPANMAEGSARKSDKEILQFLYISPGSASELDTLILLATELGFINPDSCDKLISDLDAICKLIIGFINMVKRGIG